MKITVLDERTGIPIKEEQKEPATPPNIEGGESTLLQQIGTLFDFKPSETAANKDRIETLIAFAKTQTDDHSPESLKWAIRQLTYKVGTPPLGEKMINYLGKYAYLKLEQLRLKKQVDNYERN